MVAFELFAIAHNLNAELSTLGITSKEAENDSSLYDHLIVNESLREETRELYFDGHYTRVIEEAFKLIDNLVKEKASIAHFFFNRVQADADGIFQRETSPSAQSRLVSF